MRDKLTPREWLQGIALCLLLSTGSLGGLNGSDTYLWTAAGMAAVAAGLLFAAARMRNVPEEPPESSEGETEKQPDE